LLWPVLILIGVENVSIKSESPLQSDVNFLNYPYSHSLILSFLIEIGVSIFVGVTTKVILALVVFLIACTSRWILDTLMHSKDLPLLGFGGKDWPGSMEKRIGCVYFRIYILCHLCNCVRQKYLCGIVSNSMRNIFSLLTQIPFSASQKRIHSCRKEHTRFLFYSDFTLLFYFHLEFYDRIENHF